MKELGAASRYNLGDTLRADEFINRLRGELGNRKYREMRDNDPTIGGALMAFELLIRSAVFRVDPADASEEAKAAAELVEGMFDDMEHTLDDFLAQAVTFLGFGFSIFEKVLKVRGGRTGNPATHSKFNDGLIAYRKLAPRAQWTVDRWLMDENGELMGVRQFIPAAAVSRTGTMEIPLAKLVHFRVPSTNDDPSGRSLLRNAYLSYYYASHIDMIEAIGIERELNGIPLIRVPGEFLSADATDDQKATVAALEKIGRDVKLNDQGYVMISSDVFEDAEGRPSNVRQVDFELISANSSRAIPTGETVTRHRKNIAQSILADFLTLGQGDRGSFALSKSKTDLFLAAGMGVANNIAATIRRQVIEPIWQLNGLDPATMPYARFDDIAPSDLEELGAFLRDAAGAGMPLFPDLELENTIRGQAGFPERAEEDDPDLFGTAPEAGSTEETEDDGPTT
jgi:hypothetical protein